MRKLDEIVEGEVRKGQNAWALMGFFGSCGFSDSPRKMYRKRGAKDEEEEEERNCVGAPGRRRPSPSLHGETGDRQTRGRSRGGRPSGALRKMTSPPARLSVFSKDNADPPFPPLLLAFFFFFASGEKKKKKKRAEEERERRSTQCTHTYIPRLGFQMGKELESTGGNGIKTCYKQAGKDHGFLYEKK